MSAYTAKIYFDDSEINRHSGNDLDSLLVWMLTQVQGKFGNLSGEITNNRTNLIEKQFRVAAEE
ncbi:hypothetical protein Lrub_0002 [Legionella rubrilucens]|uniref:Uncharacterized protein n=1 Tax=Legionella rubrilucens TaxID=458 RepID=A0A0W0Y6Q8_9GAMM|nr:hypothetical protein [Legionella rubrilucens]KTD52370.1 hypothetical protein Lrub_0002 [Legionella rubrilucens]